MTTELQTSPSSAPRPRRQLADPPVTYFVPTELTSPKFARAFSTGCMGRSTTDLSTLEDGSLAAFCTPAIWPLLDQAIADNRDYYYGDHGWYKRGKYYRVAKNAVQFQPTDADLRSARPFRYDLHGYETAPDWREGGHSIVICPNSHVYMRRFGLDAHEWAVDMAREIGRRTSRPIIIRWKAGAAARPLYLDLHSAHCVICFSSGAAVEALQYGVPILTAAPWAATYRMGLTGEQIDQIDQPFKPDTEVRMRFLWSLAEHQWTLAELAAGSAWKTLNRS